MGGSEKTKVGLISLGCPKNLVDSEVMLGILKENDYAITPEAEKAEVMIVNTCAFIEDSKQESVQTVLEMARLKKKGSLKKLIVTGCLAQRYQTELEDEFPEVDHIVGTGEFQKIDQFAQPKPELPVVRTAVGRPEFVYDYATPRLPVLPSHTAYVKISEGCSRVCSFCIIPKLRGPNRSRSISSILKEVKQLVERGAKEINLIAQDLTAYGLDREDGANLLALLREMEKIESLPWIRLLYSYPMHFSDELIELMARSKKICRYLDLPLQHIDGELLATMRREVAEGEVWELIRKLRQAMPDLVLRTTLIVGFPGETQAQFEKLLHFVREAEFDRLGVFTYSQEEGTIAARMTNQIPAKVKKERRDQIMSMQQEISRRKHRQMVGKKCTVLIDAVASTDKNYDYVGRTEGQALEIDGNVFLRGKNLSVGQMVSATINQASEYDLFASI